MKNNTRKALFTSVVALVICVTMLMGTTFAWFTDTAKVTVNKITAGTLTIEVKDAETKTALTELKFENSKGETAILWEPGATFKTNAFYVENTGNLALKFKVVVSGIEGDAGLLKVIDFKLVRSDDGEVTDVVSLGTDADSKISANYYITGTMDANADNDYQGMTLSGIEINIYATQDTVEYDSINNTYDANAANLLPDAEGLDNNTDDTAKTVTIETPAQLLAFAQEVNSGNDYLGYTVSLANDMDMQGMTWTPIGNANEAAGELTENSSVFAGSFDGQGHTISNLTVKSNTGNVGFFGAVNMPREAVLKNVVFDNANIVGSASQCVGVLAGAVYTNGLKWASGGYDTDNVIGITVKNSTVVGNKYVGGVVGYAQSDVVDVTVINTTVTAAYDPNYSSTTSYELGTNDSGEGAGVVTGNLYDNMTIYNANVTDCTVGGFDKIGGIAGSSRHSNGVRNSLVTNLTVKMITVNGASKTRYGLITGRVNTASLYTSLYTGNTATGTATLDGASITVTEYAIP